MVERTLPQKDGVPPSADFAQLVDYRRGAVDKKPRVRVVPSDRAVRVENQRSLRQHGVKGRKSLAGYGAAPQTNEQITLIGVTQWKRESVKNQPVVGAVREPPAPEHGPFSYRTA